MNSVLFALAGGGLIGLAASAMLFLHGRIAGISGIAGGLLTPRRGDLSWRASFLAGLLTAGLFALLVNPQWLANDLIRSPTAIVVAGLLVGFGTRLGNGCTSGHGVCGISRLSKRSLLATLTFMVSGGLTALLVSQLGGGQL